MKTILVAGITRSGLTATMHMLHAGGYPCLGSYPFEGYEMGRIPFAQSQGKAIKIVDTHLQFPPPGEYHVILLGRDHKQQAKSICKFMREVIHFPVLPGQRTQIQRSIEPDMRKIRAWARRQADCLEIRFEDIINEPKRTAERITEFTGAQLDAGAMAAVIKKRSVNCYDGLLERELLVENIYRH